MSKDTPYKKQTKSLPLIVREQDIETAFQKTLESLKYCIRSDTRDRATLEQNFREKFESLNRVQLTDSEFARLLDD
jgi:type I restriction enzyme R subunit